MDFVPSFMVTINIATAQSAWT